ncbi:MAG: T9SS type A sorting domain-containing protein, partial [Chloroherpetonaceae bacterium]
TAFGGVYLSTDMGNSWINESEELPSCMVFALAVKGDYIFASLSCTASMVLSTNMGNTWAVRMKGFADTTGDVYAFAILGDYIFAGTSGGGVYRAKISDLVLDVKEDDPAPVDIYFYPNPARDFINTAAYIGWQYQIYDLLGSCVQRGLIETERINVAFLPAGFYTIRFFKEGKQVVEKMMKE